MRYNKVNKIHYLDLLASTIAYEFNSLYVEVYPFDISFDDPFTKVQLWMPVDQDNEFY